MSVLEFLRSWSNVLLFVLNTGFAALIWAIRRSLATKEDFAEVRAAVGSLEQRVSSLEQARASAPTRDDLAALRIEMERMRGDMRAFTAELEGARQTFRAQIASHLALVERTERSVGMITEHLLGAQR